MNGSTRGYIVICFSIWLVSLIIGSAAWLNTLAGLEASAALNDQVREQYVDLGETVCLPANTQENINRI